MSLTREQIIERDLLVKPGEIALVLSESPYKAIDVNQNVVISNEFGCDSMIVKYDRPVVIETANLPIEGKRRLQQLFLNMGLLASRCPEHKGMIVLGDYIVNLTQKLQPGGGSRSDTNRSRNGRNVCWSVSRRS